MSSACGRSSTVSAGGWCVVGQWQYPILGTDAAALLPVERTAVEGVLPMLSGLFNMQLHTFWQWVSGITYRHWTYTSVRDAVVLSVSDNKVASVTPYTYP